MNQPRKAPAPASEVLGESASTELVMPRMVPSVPLEMPHARGSELAAGQRVGGYLIVRKLGQGGMGVVYEVVKENISKRAALKVLLPSYALDDAKVKRFRNEAYAV